MATCIEEISLNATATLFNTPKKGNITKTPTILKTDADQATNLDKDENLKLMINAVEVVPILAPITIGIAALISIVP
jgi:gas vesicle protein